VDIGGANGWQVRFHAAGAPGGTVGKTSLATTVKTDGQYR